MKREDIDGGTWKADDIPLVGQKKVDIDGFQFDYNRMVNMPHLLLMLIICADPSEKQKEVLDKFGVVFTDDTRRQFYPKVEEEKKDDKENDK